MCIDLRTQINLYFWPVCNFEKYGKAFSFTLLARVDLMHSLIMVDSLELIDSRQQIDF